MRLSTPMLEVLRPPIGTLGSQVASGIAWQYGLTAFRVLMTLLSTALLARLLSPQDYGLVAMSTIVTEFAALFSNFGFGAVIVQQKKLLRRHIDTIFWASTALGLALALLVALAAVPAALIFQEEALTAVLLVSGLSFVPAGLAVVPAGILQRTLRFRHEALIQAGTLVVRTAAAVGLAAAGAGFWSLVLAGVLSGVVACLWQFVYVGYWPRLRFDAAFLRRHRKTSGSFLGSGLLNHVCANVDYFVVGKRFGTTDLGFYQVAFSLPEELRTRISGPLQRVLFPAYARLREEPERFRAAVLDSQRLLAYVVLPLGGLIAILAPEIVTVLYGSKWLPVVPLLQVLAMGGALRSLFSAVASIYYATGRVDLAFKFNLYMTPLITSAVLVGSQWGVMGVAWSMLLINVMSLFSVAIAMKLIGLRMTDYIYTMLRPVITLCFVVIISIIAVSLARESSVDPFIVIVFVAFIAIVCGLILIFLMDANNIRDIKKFSRNDKI